ncbi:hypothetical protein GH722_20260 [Alphaproteobacteria bacterium HT1-32]|nr:hypothetical protein [Alphaproteobacteria bacterium HT1-32]
MTELNFAELSISVADLPVRASSLSDEAQGDVLGGFSWSRRKSAFGRASLRRKLAARKAKRYSSKRRAFAFKAMQQKKQKMKRSKRSSYLAKAAFHGRLASKYKAMARG